MAFQVTLLCLGLLFLAQSTVHQAISPITSIAITGQSGPLLSIPLGTYPYTYPIDEWVFSHWVFIVDMTDPASNPSYIDGVALGMFWQNGKLLYFDGVAQLDVSMAFGSLPLSKWIYFAMGTRGTGYSFGVVRLRGGEPYQLRIPVDRPLTSSSIFQGSNDCTSFTVRGYTGILSGRKALGQRRY